MDTEPTTKRGTLSGLTHPIRIRFTALVGLTWIPGCGGGAGESPLGGEPQYKPLLSSTAHSNAPSDGRYRYCRSLSGEQTDRVKACAGELPKLVLGKGLREEILRFTDDGDTFVVGQKLPIDAKQVIFDPTSELGELLLGGDEQAAANALSEAGVRGVVIHRDMKGAVDRDWVVLARLAHHDELDWFQLRYVTADTLLYTVRNSSTRLKTSTGRSLLEGLRSRLEGQPPRLQSWKPGSIRLIASVRLQGSELVWRHAAGNNVETVLDELAEKMQTRWERDVQTAGHGSLASRLPDLRLEIHVVMERAPVGGSARSRYEIFDLWELGVDGMMFRHRDGAPEEKFSYMPGSVALTRSIRSADAFLRFGAWEHGWRDARPWEDTTTNLDLIRDQHFMERHPGSSDEAVRLVRGMPEERMVDLTDEALQQMLIDGAEWWVRNMREDGSVMYKYWPTQNRVSDDYNEVRHILASRDLSDAWRYRQDPRYLVSAEQNMDWLWQFQVSAADPPDAWLPHPPPNSTLFRYPDKPTRIKQPNQKLGTVAVALLGWVSWAKATGSHAEDENIRAMAVYVQSQQLDNGKFEAYNVPYGHSYYGEKNDIVPGEAALALGEVAEYFGEPEWLDFFPKFLDFYEPWFKERAANTNPFGRWPHDSYDNQTRLDLVQFGPWAVMACKQYYSQTGDERAAAFGLEIADWMIDYYQWTGERTPFTDYVGGYYKLPEELPAMQTFCYSEGTAAAYEIAAQFRPEEKDKYDLSTREALRFLRVMQFDDVDSYFAPDPQILHGGIKYAMNENKVRIDYVGHGLSTVVQYLDAREVDPAVTLEIRPPDEL